MAYPIYPSVDGSNNFPPQVRAAMAASPEVKQVIQTLANAPEGLFSKGYIPDTESFDTVIIPGLYNYLGSHPSAPTSAAGSLLVGRVGQGLWRNQIIFEHGSSRAIYLRSRQNGGFTNWDRVDGQPANVKNAEQDVKITRVEGYHTRSSSDPLSVITRVPGDHHYNEVNNTEWVVQRSSSGVLSWKQVPSRTAERGNAVLAASKDADTWLSADYNGKWDIPNTSSLDSMVDAGYTPPINRPHYLDHYTSSVNISYQTAMSYDKSRLFIRTSRVPNENLGAWTEILSQASIDRGNAYTADLKNPDQWLDSSYNGRWDVGNTSTLNAVLAEGYTTPLHRPHYVDHYTSATGISYQKAYSYDTPRAFIRASRIPGEPLSSWVETESVLRESNMLTILCSGDSLVRGGDNGVDWPLEEGVDWPAKLGAKLGDQVEVVNNGKGGAFTDETLMRSARKRILVDITGDLMYYDQTPDIYLSWTPDTDGARWIGIDGKINNIPATLSKHGTTGVWSLKRRFSGDPVSVPGWNEFIPDTDKYSDGVHILWTGGNDSTRQIKGPHASTVEHIKANYVAFKESLRGTGRSILLMGMYPSMAGSGNYVQRMADSLEFNRWLKEYDPNAFVDIYTYLRGPVFTYLDLTPTVEDKSLMADGYLPRTVLADAVHPTKAAAAAIGEDLLYPHIINRGLVFKW